MMEAQAKRGPLGETTLDESPLAPKRSPARRPRATRTPAPSAARPSGVEGATGRKPPAVARQTGPGDESPRAQRGAVLRARGGL